MELELYKRKEMLGTIEKIQLLLFFLDNSPDYIIIFFGFDPIFVSIG